MTFQTWSLPIAALFFSTLKFVSAVLLSIALHLQTNGPTKRSNSTMQAYLRIFVNFKPWLARLLLLIESAYHIVKNASSLRVCYKKIPNSWYLPRVIAGAAHPKKGRVYKNAIQTLQKCYANAFQLVIVRDHDLFMIRGCDYIIFKSEKNRYKFC